MPPAPSPRTDVLLRGEETRGRVSVTDRAAGIDPPEWALQPIPEVTVVGPRIPAPV